jgi:chromosome segregation ATPase
VTNPIDELGERVATLETQVREIRADAAAARVLAGAADRDVSEFKQILQGHTRTLNALRETQVAQGERLTGLEGKFDGLEGKFDRLEGRVERLEGKVDEGFSMMSVGMAQITALLRNLEDQGDQLDQS